MIRTSGHFSANHSLGSPHIPDQVHPPQYHFSRSDNLNFSIFIGADFRITKEEAAEFWKASFGDK
jgi:hypothetical protein